LKNFLLQNRPVNPSLLLKFHSDAMRMFTTLCDLNFNIKFFIEFRIDFFFLMKMSEFREA